MNNIRIVATRATTLNGETYRRGDVLRDTTGSPLMFDDHVSAWLYINEHITKANDHFVPWVATAYPGEYK